LIAQRLEITVEDLPAIVAEVDLRDDVKDGR
jgi:hypothetical protein